MTSVNKTTLALSLIIIFISLCFSSCEKDEENKKPSLTTTAISKITSSSAISGGTITEDGGTNVFTRGIVWGEKPNLSFTDNQGMTDNGSGSGDFESNLTPLTEGKMYFYKAYATNKVGISYGEEYSFTTNAIAPELGTIVISNITSNSIEIQCPIAKDGGATITQKGYVWSKTTDPTLDSNDGHKSLAINANELATSIEGLERITEYKIRSYATNSIGTTYSDIISFSTLPELPEISIMDVYNVFDTSLESSYNITDDGGINISKAGLIISKQTNPDINNYDINIESSTLQTGQSTLLANSLEEGTRYYLKAYASNNTGISYSEQHEVSTKVKDYDGNLYSIVIINDQTWFAENLRVTHYPNSEPIANGAGLHLDGQTNPAYYFSYDDDEANVETYGRLYTWHTAIEACPTGWHSANKSDWWALFDFIGWDIVSGKLKSLGTIENGDGLWHEPNTGASNEYGLNIVPAGTRNSFSDTYSEMGQSVYYIWGDDSRSGQSFIYNNQGAGGLTDDSAGKSGNPVRCVKD